MKRGKKLGLSALVLLVLIGGTMLAKSRTTEIIELEEEEKTVLFERDADTLTALSWTSEGETITLQKDGESWCYEADPAFPLSTAKTETLLRALTNLQVVKTIENPESLSVYGLEDPVLSVTVSAETETSFEVGSGESMDGYRYLSNGDGKVYLVEKSFPESFSVGLYDLVRKESLPDMSKLNWLSVRSEVQDYEIDHIENSGIAYTDQYKWFLKEEDGWLTLDSTLAEEFADQVRILAWQKCVDYRADETALAAYGLDRPSVTAELCYTESKQVATEFLADDGEPIYETVEEEKIFTLEIGDYVDSYCYARIAGSPMVYQINSSVCDSLLYMSYDELRPSEVILLDMDELTRVEVSLDGETYTFQKAPKTVADEEGNSSTEMVYLFENEKETSFSDVLSDLQYMRSDNYAGAETPKRSAELGFVFYRSNGEHPQIELIFYSYDSSTCLVTLDGESTVFVDRYSVNALAEQVQNLVKED